MSTDIIRHSTIIEAIHAWRSSRDEQDKNRYEAAVLRMHPKTALEIEANALEYPYNATHRTADGLLRIWGVPIEGDESINIGAFEVIPQRGRAD